MLTLQQKWNRYVDAINFCISYGYYINCIDSKGGNVKAITVFNPKNQKHGFIKLKPKKYKPMELLIVICENVGTSW